MPSHSKSQARLMAMVCHNPEMAKKTGISKSVACDFNKADTKTGILKDSEGNITLNGTQIDGNITMDVPLLIRILEHAREELKSDNELHEFAEKLIACQYTQEVLDMSCFDKIVPSTPEVNEMGEIVGIGKTAAFQTRPRKNFSQKAMAIIDGAIKAIAPHKTGNERTAALKEYCKDHKVKYQQVYDAIVVETGEDYFTDSTTPVTESIIASFKRMR